MSPLAATTKWRAFPKPFVTTVVLNPCGKVMVTSSSLICLAGDFFTLVLSLPKAVAATAISKARIAFFFIMQMVYVLLLETSFKFTCLAGIIAMNASFLGH
jgi:hypothetical protein